VVFQFHVLKSIFILILFYVTTLSFYSIQSFQFQFLLSEWLYFWFWFQFQLSEISLPSALTFLLDLFQTCTSSQDKSETFHFLLHDPIYRAFFGCHLCLGPATTVVMLI